MVEIRSYSIDELEDLTGFNPRTISYYIQQGLLPKVGRRGRSTRYPQLFVDRLKFIQRVRELQDSGRLGSVTLPRIARVIWYLIEQSGDNPDFSELDDGEIQRLFEDEEVPDKRILGESEHGDLVSVSFGKFGPYVRAGDATASIDAQEFNSITLEDALSTIGAKREEQEKQLIKEFKDEGICVLDGPYGPYIRHRGVNVRIPASIDPTQLTRADCENLIAKKRDKLAVKKSSKRKDRLSARLNDTVQMRRPREFAPTAMLSFDDSVDMSDEATKPKVRRRAQINRKLPEPIGNEPDRLVQKIERHAREDGTRPGGRTQTWTRAPITDHIEITVQGIDPKNAELVEELAQKIRNLLGVDALAKD